MGTRIWTSVRWLLDLVGPNRLMCGMATRSRLRPAFARGPVRPWLASFADAKLSSTTSIWRSGGSNSWNS